MPGFDIPEYWSAQEALAVYEFLEELQQRIWDYYDVRLVDLMKSQRCYESSIDSEALGQHNDDFDDEIPF